MVRRIAHGVVVFEHEGELKTLLVKPVRIKGGLKWGFPRQIRENMRLSSEVEEVKIHLKEIGIKKPVINPTPLSTPKAHGSSNDLLVYYLAHGVKPEEIKLPSFYTTSKIVAEKDLNEMKISKKILGIIKKAFRAYKKEKEDYLHPSI